MTMASTYAFSVVVFIYLLSLANNQVASRTRHGPTLKMLFNVFRHGARCPGQLIPGDPNNDKWLRLGLTELTNIGKQQQISNGQITRKRYDQFLGPYYNSTKFYIQSSLFNRCVMSGQAFTTGLFPPHDFQIWEDGCLGHNWQPIPVFTTNIANDNAKLAPLIAAFSQIPTNSTVYVKNKETIEAIANATGMTSINNSMTIFSYADALVCEIYNEDPLPFGLAAYKDGIFQLMDDIFNVVLLKYSPVLAAILLNDMVDRIQSFNNGTSSVKTSVYSLSDAHVAAVMNSLTNSTVGEPQFASAVYLELYSPDDSISTDYFMIWYRPKLLAETKAYYIKDCGYKCPFENFIRLVNDINVQSNNFSK